MINTESCLITGAKTTNSTESNPHLKTFEPNPKKRLGTDPAYISNNTILRTLKTMNVDSSKPTT